MLKTLTYGQLPTFDEFRDAFYNIGDRFKFRNDKRVGDVDMTCTELWNELQKAVGEWSDDKTSPDLGDVAGQWASDVLFILGFEWV